MVDFFPSNIQSHYYIYSFSFGVLLRRLHLIHDEISSKWKRHKPKIWFVIGIMIRDSGYFNNVCAEIEKKNQRNEISQRQRQSTRRIHYNRPQSLFTKEPKNNQQIANIFICKLAVTKLQESINHLAFFGVLRDSVFVCVCDGLSVRERETEADEDRDRNAWRRDNATEATTELSLYYIFVSRWLARYQKWLFFPRFYSFALIFFAETFRLCRVTHLHFVNARLVQRLELFVTSVGQNIF